MLMRLVVASRNWAPIARFLYRGREKAFFVGANELVFEANMMIRSEKPLEAFKVDDKEQRFSHAQIL